MPPKIAGAIIRELHRIVDTAIETRPASRVEDSGPYDLSGLDFERLKKEFTRDRAKKTNVQRLKQAVETRLRKLLLRNPLRADLQARFEKIVADYNREKDRVTIERTFEELLKLVKDLDREESRAIREGLDEESLALFDLLRKDDLSAKETETGQEGSGRTSDGRQGGDWAREPVEGEGSHSGCGAHRRSRLPLGRDQRASVAALQRERSAGEGRGSLRARLPRVPPGAVAVLRERRRRVGQRGRWGQGMEFLDAVRTCLFRKYFEFRGRASRAEYWWFVLFGGLISVPADLTGSDPVEYLVTGILFLPRLAVTVRRLHDTDRSGWWVLLSLVGWIPGVRWWVVAVPTLVLVWFMVEKGDAGANRHGPNPVPDAVLGLSRAGGSPSHNHD